jgi:hypothetical protein
LQKHLGFNPSLSGLQCEANNAKDKSKWIASLKMGITAGVQGTVPGMFAPLILANSGGVWFMELPKSMMLLASSNEF